MNIELITEKDEQLFSRKQAILEVKFDKQTPSRNVLGKEISSKLGTKEELVVIKHIYTAYGDRKARIIVNVYSDESVLGKVEHNFVLKKLSGKKKDNKEPEGAETKDTAAPAAEPEEKK